MQETDFGTVAPGLVGLHAMLAGLRLSLRSSQLSWALKSNYNPAQPRVARGLPGGGQWTDDGVGSPARSQSPPGAGPPRVGDLSNPSGLRSRAAGHADPARAGLVPAIVSSNQRWLRKSSLLRPALCSTLPCSESVLSIHGGSHRPARQRQFVARSFPMLQRLERRRCVSMNCSATELDPAPLPEGPYPREAPTGTLPRVKSKRST